MTDRHAGYVVTLAGDIREDQVEPILNALRMISGVVAVTPVVSDPITQQIAATRRDAAWVQALTHLTDCMEEHP